MRRGGARREVSDRVVLRQGTRTLEGWALNVSRGGLRIISEGVVELGEIFDISLGDDPLERVGKVVWLQQEPDGFICGLAYVIGADESPKTVPPPPPGSQVL